MRKRALGLTVTLMLTAFAALATSSLASGPPSPSSGSVSAAPAVR